MKIYVPSRGRFNPTTVASLLGYPVTLVVPESQRESYLHLGLETLTVPDSMKLPVKRDWIVKQNREDKFAMFDDDLSFCKRVNKTTARKISDPQDIGDMISRLDGLLTLTPTLVSQTLSILMPNPETSKRCLGVSECCVTGGMFCWRQD